MQWETARNESFTRREVRQVHTISEATHEPRDEREHVESSDRFGRYVNGNITNGTDTSHETSRTKRTIYMMNGDTATESTSDRYLYRKRGSDASDQGSLQRTYSSGSGTGRKLSGSSIGSTGSGTKISSVTMPIRSASFSTTRKPSNSRESPVQASSSVSTESSPTKPSTLPRTSSLVKQRTPSDPKSGIPEVNVTYNLKMKLGEVKGSGADGNVYIQLFGSKGNTAKIQLRQAGDEKNRFETGQEYKFMVTTLDIGKVERIKLSHDHMEYGTGFHVKEVEIDVPSYGNHYTFPCNCWLAQDKLTEMTVKDLNSSTPAPNKGYTVSVHLGKVLDPYTKLYLQLCGENEESTKIVLRPSGTATDSFQEGKTYKFSVEMPDIGKVERIRVGHDSHGSGKGIFVDDIEVAPDDAEPLYFPCSCWLAEDIGDGKLEREIYPGTRTPHTSESDITHTVSVRLGEVLNPEATLYIYLIGRRGETSKVFLRPEEPLEREKTYKFTLALTVDIGRIEKIRLGQDSRGYGKGLFVDSVRVVPTDGDPAVMFPCACWLAEDVWDSKTERELLPGKAVKRPENAAYNLTFKTGDMPYAGTDANVTLQLFGDKGQTEKIMLRQESGKTLKRFDRGRTDRFTVQTMDVGKVERIRLSHDNSGPNPEWYLESLKIEIPSRDEKYMFPCNRWLTGDEDRRVEVEVYPVDEDAVQEERITFVENSQESAAPEPEPEPEPEMAEYQVSFRLGEVLDPYTKLFMVIHGDRGDTEKIYLTPEGGRLEPGKLYTVNVRTTDVGKVRNISMGQEGLSPNQGVFVEEVEVTAPKGPSVVFPCRCWLAEDEDDGQTTRVLVPGQSLTSQYDIGFRLGEVLDPDTKLYMVLYGDKGESGRIYLSPDGSKFEPDKFYKVSVNIKDIGNVQKVHIGHDSKGRNKGVFVEEIEVTAPDAPKVIFPCRCWLAENEDDGKTARVIVPGESLTQPYDIAFRLGEVADPRAKLYMILYGRKGESGKIYLASPDGKKFEPGRLYTVSANIRDIGPVEKISLGNESRGPGHGVFVEEVEVAAPNEEPAIFPCRCWLAEDEGDGKSTRVLQPGETVQPPYDILFRLGEVLDPRAKLYMILYGDKGESGKIYLTPSDGTTFEPGKQYRVSVNIKDIGKINKVYLGNDSHGRGRGVFVEEIEVQCVNEDPVIFPCRCWLAEDEGDGKTARVLVPGETIQPQLGSCLYNMTFETAEDVPFAGTDAVVYVQLFGENGQTEKIEFKSENKLEAPKFKRGRIDKFAVETADIGKLTKLRVGHDNTGRNPEWFLRKLSIEIPSRDENYVFEYNNWIAGEEVKLDPVDEKTRTDLYTIHLKLGEVADPYTPVWIQLVGEKGESGQIQIKPGYGPNDKFEKDRIYKVVARVANIGRIIDVKVGQDVSGAPSKGLYVEEVVVTASRGDGVVFPCHCWTGDEDKVTVEHVQQTEQEVPLDTTYQVTFKTGDRPNAGTSAKVQFELFGDKGKTEPIQLSEDKSLRLFERGNSDKFKVDTRDVGKIEKLHVCHDNSGRDPDWYLEEVTIDVPDKGEQYIFPCHRWLVGSQRDVDLVPAERKDLLQEVDYRIMVKTGDESDAGTDANVYLQMFGDKGKTQNFALREEGDKRRFERGRMDKFLIRTQDIGKLSSVRIGRDNKGVKPGWLVDKITIDVDEKDEHYVFYCNRWLGSSDTAVEFMPEQGSLPGQDGMYTVSVKVGEVLDPEVNPFYQIIGRNGETNKIRLRDGYSRSHVFTKGNTYKVSVKSPDVGEITKLRIGDDGSGRGKTMFVEEVTVTSKQGDTIVFPCKCWLGKDDDNGKIIRELIPGKPVPEALEDISYHMTIKTGDKPNAGTDANVYFALHGDKGKTPRIALQDESRTFRRFEQARADKFVVQTADVGKLEQLIIGHDNTGEDPAWYLDEVDVDIPVRDEHYKFRYGGWLGGDQPGQRKEAVLFPVDDIEGPVTPIDIEPVQESGAGLGDSEYDVEFKTGAEENAGTDANVYFQMIGEEGESQEIELKNKGKGYFNRAQLDRFRIRANDVGRLKMLRVGHDNSGSNSRWLLDEVVIYSLARGERYVFKGGRWIGGKNNQIDLPLDSWNFGQLVGQEPDIPDLIDFMQSGDELKIINAARYLQHLCYSKESVKDKVRELGGIPVIVRLLRHSEWRVRYAAICLLRNLSFSMRHDGNRLAIADCGGIEALIEILQETEKTEYREAILGVLCNLSSVESLRLRILLVCLHIIVIVIIIPYSEWTAIAARGQPPVRTEPWAAVLVHATRLVRNLSSAGARARQELRDEKDLVDCLVWITRVGVKNEHYDNRCLEHCVCTLRNLSYRLESEVDRDRYDDADVDVDPAAVKEQQSQGCFAGCGGRKKKKVPNDKRPMDRPKGPPQGVELLWQAQTVQQYYVLLRKAKNTETLEGSAGALHNLTACSWKWAIKIRGDTRKAQVIPQIVELLRIDYDPTIRAAAIALRNLCVDSENKRSVGEKAITHLVFRLPTGEEEERLVQDPTVASVLCAIFQLTNKSDKNCKYLRKTKGVQKIVKIATDQNQQYSPRVIKIANQVLSNLWNHSQLQQQIKKEGWQPDPNRSAELARAPMDYEATSLPQTPDERNRRDPNSSRLDGDDDQWRSGSRRRDNWGNVNGEPTGGTDISSESDKQRSWGESLNQIPPPYTSDDNYSRGSRSRDDLPMEVMSTSSRPSAANSSRDENDNPSDRTLRLQDSGGGGGKNEDLWV